MGAKRKYDGLELAIIGISAEFPHSKDYRVFWENLVAGRELTTRFSKEELINSGVPPETIADEHYVPSGAVLSGKEYFDSAFFEYRPEEAALMDPQIRLFHQHCWAALEDAGCVADVESQKIGLFASASDNDNWKIYAHNRPAKGSIDPFYLRCISNHKFIATLTAYKLNLKGPVMYVDTACSSSLVTVDVACRSLLTRECNIALVGAARMHSIREKGYFYQEGMISSPDGHCRTFDSLANGTFSGEGVGVVVLKRLKDAIRDNDHIYSIILSSAVNNDGNDKAGFTAPGIKGQAESIRMAHRVAGIEPTSIGYVEAHGTATKLGDPIEIMGLKQAFAVGNEKFCALGSVKSNMGHLDTAAGIAGLIKTALMLKNRQIPPSLHFTHPNPQIDLENSPFYVNTRLKEWTASGDSPLRAGVSSFGIGGTNAHILLEEAPDPQPGDNGRPCKLLLLSARTSSSLTGHIQEMRAFLECNDQVNLADMAYTLQTGRRHFGYRVALPFHSRVELLGILDQEKLQEQGSRPGNSQVVFMFPGQGSQYAGMGKDLYENDAFFRQQMDKGFLLLKEWTGYAFKDILFGPAEAGEAVNSICNSQPLIFIFEYALASLLLHWGVVPHCMIGHSIGEYVAACISGLFRYEDALRLVLKRGELMNGLPQGAMLSASLPAAAAERYLDRALSIAAINSPGQVSFSGTIDAIAALKYRLEQNEIDCAMLRTTHAGHCAMLDPILDPFGREFDQLSFGECRWPIVSNLTGEFVTRKEYASPEYWIKHFRNTVKFSAGIRTILDQQKNLVFVEVGPGHALTKLLKQHGAGRHSPPGINLVRHPHEKVDDVRFLTEQLGRLWQQGGSINWQAYYEKENRRKISLPAYVFEKTKFPAEVDGFEFWKNQGTSAAEKKSPEEDWFYRPQWKQSDWLPGNNVLRERRSVLLFSSGLVWETKITDHLAEGGIQIVRIGIESTYKRYSREEYSINPADRSGYERLFNSLKEDGIEIGTIIHCWNCEAKGEHRTGVRDNIRYFLTIGYDSLLDIVRNVSKVQPSATIGLVIAGNGLFNVGGQGRVQPIKATLTGAAKVIRVEFPNILPKVIDVGDPGDGAIDAVVKELEYDCQDIEVAIRHGSRYVLDHEHIKIDFSQKKNLFRKGGTYLISGTGGMAYIFSSYLAEQFKASLILTGRQERPVSFIRELEEKGASVYYIRAALPDGTPLLEGIREAEKIMGPVNGVIHTAGVGDFGGAIQLRNAEEDDKVFSSKLYGTEWIYSLFEERELDFFINCSSRSAAVAPFGQVAYTAANLFQEAFALAGAPKFPVISIGWDKISETGMAVNITRHLSAAEQKRQLRLGMSSKQAVDVLSNALFLRLPVQIISTVDFKQFLLHYLAGLDRIKGKDGEEDLPVPLRERPELKASYVPPQTSTEKAIGSIMEGFFGIGDIGIEDNFFELGGDSLKAMGLLSRIRKTLSVHLTIRHVFEFPTIRQMSAHIDAIKPAVSRPEKKLTKII